MSYWPEAHYNNADEYLVAGFPFVTSSAGAEVGNTTPVEVKFPNVTQWIKVFNNSGAATTLRVGFTSNGVKGVSTKNYFVLSGTTNSSELQVKCTSLFLLADTAAPVNFSVMAGMTNVKKFVPLTGSISGSTNNEGFIGVG